MKNHALDIFGMQSFLQQVKTYSLQNKLLPRCSNDLDVDLNGDLKVLYDKYKSNNPLLNVNSSEKKVNIGATSFKLAFHFSLRYRRGLRP